MKRELYRTIVILGLLISCLSLPAQTVPFPTSAIDPDKIEKWGYSSVGTNWDTSPFLPFRYAGKHFRLMPPNEVTFDSESNTWTFPSNERYPVILFFHGRGEIGQDNNNQLKHGGKRHRDAVISGEFPGFLLYPQNTDPEAMKALLDKMIADGYPIDQTRVYVHGLSNGAKWTWQFAIDYPEVVTAAFPISGVVTDNYDSLVYTPFRLAQGGLDKNPSPAFANQVVDAITDIGGQVDMFYLPTSGHGIWNQMYNRSDFFSWFLDQKLNKIYAKYRYDAVCPGDSISVTLGVNPGLQDYEWKKNGVLITGANSNELNVNEFGDYSVRININGNWSDWSEIHAVNERQATQTPPIVLAKLQSIVLPDPNQSSSVALTLPSGFESYKWYKDSALVSTEDTLFAYAGTYWAIITERYSCSSVPSVPFNVYSNTGVDVPDHVSSIDSVLATKTSISLSWINNPAPSVNETGFELYRRTDTSDPYTLIALLSTDVNTFEDHGLEAGVTYFYSVRPINENGAAVLSAELSVTTDKDNERPLAPKNLRISASTHTSISLEWNEALDDVGVDHYLIYQNGLKTQSVKSTDATIYNLKKGNTYDYSVIAVDKSGNKSPFSQRIFGQATLSGLRYKYYEGTWSSLPDFNTLIPQKEGNSKNIDISLRDVNDNFAFYWDGYIIIPEAGNYTFETYSDDGSKLYIGAYDEANLIVDNDGLHGNRYREGTYNFPIAGVYPIVMTFFERGGGQKMQVFWKNTAHGITNRQEIPDAAFSDGYSLPQEYIPNPFHLVIDSITHNSLGLRWQDTTSKATHYQILRAQDNDPLGFNPIAILPSSSKSYVDKGLQPGTSYRYVVNGLGKYGESKIYTNPIPNIHHMDFENDLTDISGNEVISSSINNPSYDSLNKKTGKYAVHFNGADDLVNLDVGDKYVHSTIMKRSVSFWLFVQDSLLKQDIYDEGGGTNGYAIRLKNDSIEFSVQNNDSIQIINAPVEDSVWTHVSTSFDNGVMKLYLDGQLIVENQNVGFNQIYAHNDAAGLGGSNGSNAFDEVNNNFSGWIDDLFITDEALTLGHISALIARQEIVSVSTLALPDVPIAVDSILMVASFDSVGISWHSALNVDIYNVYRATASPINFSLVGEISSSTSNNQISYSDGGLVPNENYYYKIEAVNLGGSVLSEVFFVRTLNRTPVIDPIDDVVINFYQHLELSIQSQDLDGNSGLIVSSDWLPSFVSLSDQGNGVAILTLAPTGLIDVGTYQLSVAASDLYGASDTTFFSLTITDNYSPTISSLTSLSVNENETFVLLIGASDLNGDSLTWDFDMPGFISAHALSMDTTELHISPNLTEAGTYDIGVQVSDGRGGVDNVTISLHVLNKDLDRYTSINFTRYNMTSDVGYWNNITSTSANTTLINPLDHKGDTTSFQLTLLDSWANIGNLGVQNTIVYPDNVSRSYYYAQSGSKSIKLSNLDTTKNYTLQVYASRSGNGTRITNYEVQGELSSLNVLGNAIATVDFENISPSQLGEITLVCQASSGSPYYYINALTLIEHYDDGMAPAAPYEFAAAISESAVEISWKDRAFNESGYNIYRLNGDSLSYNLLGTVSANDTTYTDFDVLPGEFYSYKLGVFNGVGENTTSPFGLTVPNLAPYFTSALASFIELESNTTTIINIDIADTPGDTLTISLLNAPAFMMLDSITNTGAQMIMNPTLSEVGYYAGIQLLISDGVEVVIHNFDLEVEIAGLEDIYVNFTGNITGDIPWNNFVTTGAAGSKQSNLLTTDGDTTSVSIELLDGWAGVNGLGMTSGVFPTEVCKTALWESKTTPRRILVAGLDTAKVYSFGMFTSRNGGGNRITHFAIDDQEVSQNAAYNVDEISSIEGVICNANGEIVLSCSKGNTSSYSYLNALLINAVPRISSESDSVAVFEEERDSIPLIALGSSFDAIELNWADVYDGEVAYEIWRSESSNLDSFFKIDSLPFNTVNYLDTAIDNYTLYHYQVRAVFDTGDSAYSNVSKSSAIAFEVLLNLNVDQPANSPWNNTNGGPFLGQVVLDLKNSLGQPTGISMFLKDENPLINPNTYGFTGDNPFGMNTGNDSGVVPDDVMRSTFWMDKGMTAELQFSGLDQNFEYTLEFFASRNGSGDRTTVYQIGEEAVSLNASYNTSEVVAINLIEPSELGTILVEVKPAASSLYGYLGAVVIRAYVKDTENAQLYALRMAIASLLKDEISEEVFQPIIHPNPAMNQIYIDLNGKDVSQIDARLIDLSGKEVILQKYGGSRAGETILLENLELNISLLNPGVYLLELITNDGSISIQRIIKQ